jgi:hypothetical protein
MTLKKLSVAVAMIVAGQAQAANTWFDNITPLAASTGVIANYQTPFSLPASLSQKVLADRATQNTLVSGSNSGSWDMITANETGPDAGRFLFMPFETGNAGVQRVDLWDANYNTRTVTIVAPGTQGFVSGDASAGPPGAAT